MRPRGPARQQQDGHVRACEQEQQQRRREDQQEGRHKLGRPLWLNKTRYARPPVLRKAVRRLSGELVEERLKSLFGQPWSNARLETGLDAPCEVRIERQIEGNENLRTRIKVLTRQHANHGVGFAVQREGLPHGLSAPAERSLP